MPRPPAKKPFVDRAKIIELGKTGAKLDAIALEVGCSKTLVSMVLTQNGPGRRKRIPGGAVPRPAAKRPEPKPPKPEPPKKPLPKLVRHGDVFRYGQKSRWWVFEHQVRGGSVYVELALFLTGIGRDHCDTDGPVPRKVIPLSKLFSCYELVAPNEHPGATVVWRNPE